METAKRPPLTLLDGDEKEFQALVAEFADNEIKPRVSKMDQSATLDPEIIPSFFEMGLMGIEIPEQYGGAGGSFFQALIAVEELSRVDPSVGVFVDVQNTLVNNALMRWANEDQKKRYLPKLAKEWVGAYALSEASSGSDAFALKCRARQDGNKFILNGSKLWITNAAEASLFIVFATIDPEKGYKGITAFLVEKGSPGFKLGKKEDKLGIRASSTCELIFEDTPVPAENVLGQVGMGYKAAIETLNEGRIGIGAQMVGLARGALDCGVAYSKERLQFGKPISHFQAIRFALAQCATEIEAARLLVYNAARLREAGAPFLDQAAMAKLFSSQVAERVASQIVEVYGGYGFTKEYPVEKYYRDAKIGKIYEGTSNMQLNTLANTLVGKGG